MYTIKDQLIFKLKKLKNNQVFKIFVCYFLSFAFVKGTSFLLIPLYANFMEKAEYGHFAFLITLLSLFSLLTDLGLNNGLYRYIKNKKRDKLILCSVLTMSFIVNLLTYLAVLFLIGYLQLLPYEVHVDHLTILFASLILSSFLMLNLTYFRIHNKASKYLVCSVSQPFFHLSIFSILIITENVNINNLLLSTLISNIITTIITLSLNRKNFMFSFRIKTMKRLIKYTLGTTISILALYVLTGFDKFFLAYFITPELLADYSLVILFASITILLMEPISLWYFANRFKLLENKIKFERITSYLIIFNLWVASIVFINGSFIYKAILPENYNLDIIIYFFAVLSFHLKYLSTILNIGCYINKDTNIVAKINLSVATFVLILYLFLTSEHNSLGIIFSVLIGYAIILICNIYFSQKRLKVDYKKNEIIPNYIGSFIIVFIIFDFNFNFLISNIILLTTLFVINIKGLKYVKYNANKTKGKDIEQLPL